MHFAFCISSAFLAALAPCPALAALPDTIDQLQPKVVKIHGAGGFHGLTGQQTGILISPDGHILTTYGAQLDTDELDVVLADGRKCGAKLLGADPRLDIAVLKIDAAGLPFFDLAKAAKAEPGTRILALSNLFGVAAGNEPVSVQRGTVAAAAPLHARRGAFDTPYHGPVYVLDVTTSNPGSAGGALVTREGQILGLLGKELQDAFTNTWLNYAVPIDEVRASVEDIRTGRGVTVRDDDAAKRPARPLDFASLGVELVPDVLERTPPYVDRVRPGSSAAKAGVRPDDLVLMLGDRLVPSCKTLMAELEYIDRDDPVQVTLLRRQQIVVVTLQSSGNPSVMEKERP